MGKVQHVPAKVHGHGGVTYFMKIEIRLPAQANIEVKKSPFTFQYGDFHFVLNADKTLKVNYVIVSNKIDACDKEYINQWREVRKLTEIGSISEKYLPFPLHPTDKKIIRVLKLFENVLADECDLRLEWDKINCHYYAESEKEEELMKSGEICRGWGRIRHVKQPCIIEDSAAITCRMEYSEGLDIELDFFRHANMAVKEENFIEAFFNLYLILESHYAGGKFRYQEKVFKGNKILIGLIRELIEDKKQEKLYAKILDKGQELTAENVLNQLVNTIKKLFHFLDINNPEKFINYDNQEECKDYVFALRGIVWRCMRKKHKDFTVVSTESPDTYEWH